MHVGRNNEEADYRMKVNEKEYKNMTKWNQEKDLGVILIMNFSVDIHIQISTDKGWKETSVSLLLIQSIIHQFTKSLFLLNNNSLLILILSRTHQPLSESQNHTQDFGMPNQKHKHMFWSLFISRGHSTREPASVVCDDKKGDILYSEALHS